MAVLIPILLLLGVGCPATGTLFTPGGTVFPINAAAGPSGPSSFQVSKNGHSSSLLDTDRAGTDEELVGDQSAEKWDWGGGRLLGGVYPDFTAPAYTPTTSVCDVTASPWSAKGDGTTDVTSGIQAAIDKCPRDPDGRFTILLKKGNHFVTGSLNLTSGCRLVVDGALLGSTDPAMYI